MKLTEFLNEWVKNPDNYTFGHHISFDSDVAINFKKTDELLSKLKECDEFKSSKNLQFIDSLICETSDGNLTKIETILYQNKQKTTHVFKLNNYIYSIQLIPILKTSEEFLKEEGFGCFTSKTKCTSIGLIPYKEICFKIPLENDSNTSLENQILSLLKDTNISNLIVGYDVFLRGIFYSSYELDDMIFFDKKNTVSYLNLTQDENSSDTINSLNLTIDFAYIPDDCIDDFQKEFGIKNCVLSLDKINTFLINHNHPPVNK